MLKNNKDRWGRDEFQVAETGKIDTRDLYIAMGWLTANTNGISAI
ncbi:hypothetical protein [Convivina praedatoris]|uniref:Uncharacterized protein n=1 Tax=Convivina praedatoris TaxID=2880963 RepID=A0ABM9D309_9LACO|nr:hypothetical protein [Convivina sp. LMG 32447]CAH1855918.1 hypothetical protein R077815_01312 [Convivina sp. LMG 32447]CAH1856574.1 hypothetical protein LMG032447_01318 [Convivina sp. LMG 32447]CAH1856902.1 hypothetical protein R078138_01465 [Convivina sp. LMG 32447]